jgi:hypothetical protein
VAGGACQFDQAQVAIMKRLVAAVAVSGLTIGGIVTLLMGPPGGVQPGGVSDSPPEVLEEGSAWAATGPMDLSTVPKRIRVYGRQGEVVGYVFSADAFSPTIAEPVVYDEEGDPIGHLTEGGFKGLDKVD